MVIFLITKDGRLSAKGMPHLVIMLATQANLGATLRQIAVCLPNCSLFMSDKNLRISKRIGLIPFVGVSSFGLF